MLIHYVLMDRSRIVLKHFKLKRISIVEKYKKEELLGLRIMVVNLTAHNPSFHSFVLPSLCSLITLAIPTLPLTGSSYIQTFYLLAFYPMLVEYHS